MDGPNEFKEDILKSLLINDAINVNVKQSLESSNLRNCAVTGWTGATLSFVQFCAKQNQLIEDKINKLISLSEKNLHLCKHKCLGL